MNKEAKKVKDKTEKHAGEWVENYARIGIAAKGVVYILVGVLAALAVFGLGGQNGGRKGVLQTILEQPYGQILLGAVIIGLLGYVVWRMIQVFSDPDGNGKDTEGLIKRSGYFISGLVYFFFALAGFRMLFPTVFTGGGSNGGNGGREMLVSKALQQPFGQWLVGIAAALVIGKGIYQLFRAFSGKFKRTIKEEKMNSKERSTFMRMGRIGYTARGVVLGIIGYFLIQAAVQADPDEAQGTEGALDFLSSTGGPYLMAAVAIGLAVYGVFMFFKSKYRYMPNIARKA